MKYLYGASVQGIQEFIFQTNRLKEIAGASELVEEICTTQFARLLKNDNRLDYRAAKDSLSKDKGMILFAAGNIKCVFEDKGECERIVLSFPKMVAEYAPGITISQAVVEFTDEAKFSEVVTKLEERLKVQRNKPVKSITLGSMGVSRSRQNGKPVVYAHKGNFWDAATLAKFNYFVDNEDGGTLVSRRTTQNLCQKAFGQWLGDKQIAYDTAAMTGKNDWLAIIHADGNGMGQVVQEVGKDPELFKNFSIGLDDATTSASVAATRYIQEKYPFSAKESFPIRPIVLGGDDLTVICRADVAIDFVQKFMLEFENETQNRLGRKLTSCAGIAYVKSSFPFHFAYKLAEELCGQAKKDAKSKAETGALAHSCLMFHKVQDSMFSDYASLEERELTPQERISFKFGPYYVSAEPSRWTIDELNGAVAKLGSREGNAVKSHLRQWMSALHSNPDAAKQSLERLKSMTEMKKYVEKLTTAVARGDKDAYPVYDVLAINTINNQRTK